VKTATLTITQAAVAVIALVGITLLGITNHVDSDAVLAIYSAVIGAGLGASGAIAQAHATRLNNAAVSELVERATNAAASTSTTPEDETS
jgi:pantoate kinase